MVVAEGGQYVADHPDSADVLMVDGFDGVGLVDQLFLPAVFRRLCRRLERTRGTGGQPVG